MRHTFLEARIALTYCINVRTDFYKDYLRSSEAVRPLVIFDEKYLQIHS